MVSIQFFYAISGFYANWFALIIGYLSFVLLFKFLKTKQIKLYYLFYTYHTFCIKSYLYMHYSGGSYSLEHHLETRFVPRLSRAICFISGYDKILEIGGIYCLTDISVD
jgi:hypothetical protein